MRTDEAIKFYGSQSALARALDISQASVAVWKKYPPARRQLALERITEGKLKAEPDCMALILDLPKSDSKDAR